MVNKSYNNIIYSLYSAIIFGIFMLTSCNNDTECDTAPLFHVSSYIHLNKIADDITVELNQGIINMIKLGEDEPHIYIQFSDPASLSQNNRIGSKEYILTITSKTVLPTYPLGYKIKIVSNELWTDVSKIYDSLDNEILFTRNNINEITLKIEN